MIGPVVMGFAVAYLLASVAVVRGAIRYARKNGRNAKRWGWGAALVMYLIPFWDWLPTVAVHQYACATEAGLQVHKTFDHWIAENPGVMATLVTNRGEKDNHKGDMTNFTATHFWNDRINLVTSKNGPMLFRVWRHQQAIIDSKTGETLAQYVDFSTGNGNVGGEPELRFWLHSDGCIGNQARATDFVRFARQFRGAER